MYILLIQLGKLVVNHTPGELVFTCTSSYCKMLASFLCQYQRQQVIPPVLPRSTYCITGKFGKIAKMHYCMIFAGDLYAWSIMHVHVH